MGKTERRTIGDLGEDITCKYLENKGFSLIDRNYLRPWGEIDIVATKGDKIHFVEVKTVTREPSQGGYRPEENIHGNKKQRLSRIIQTYLTAHRVYQNRDFQVDVACVYINKREKRAKIRILQNIVL